MMHERERDCPFYRLVSPAHCFSGLSAAVAAVRQCTCRLLLRRSSSSSSTNKRQRE